jgi:hypothetical protein
MSKSGLRHARAHGLERRPRLSSARRAYDHDGALVTQQLTQLRICLRPAHVGRLVLCGIASGGGSYRVRLHVADPGKLPCGRQAMQQQIAQPGSQFFPALLHERAHQVWPKLGYVAQ